MLRYWSGTGWTEHTSPAYPSASPAPRPLAPAPVPASAPPPGRDHSGRWYFVITVLSAGALSGVPFFHAASQLDRPSLRTRGAVLTGAGVAGVMMNSASDDAFSSGAALLQGVSSLLMISVVVVACLMLVGLRREVYGGAARPLSDPPPSPNDRAVAGVEAARRKRAEARALAEKDPMMARELGIGRPASAHPYDDGGLLDLNAATADDLVRLCGLSSAAALEVVAARTCLGRFLHVEDAIVYGEVGEDAAALVRDRGIVISDG